MPRRGARYFLKCFAKLAMSAPPRGMPGGRGRNYIACANRIRRLPHCGMTRWKRPLTGWNLKRCGGRNLTDRGLSDDEINLLFINDMRLARQICRRLYADFSSFSPDRQAALLSMAFNLGAPRLAKFQKMRAAIAADDWQAVAAEALASKWAGQLPQRAAEIARLLRG